MLAAALGALTLASPADARAAVTQSSSFTPHDGPGRSYLLFTPSGDTTIARPLVVYLHGCTQTAEDAAIGTRWNELAERKGFVVVYPEQDLAANGAGCWNWFEPDQQVRGSGEPAIITAIVAEVVASMKIDATRVYVAGASAGADMATILGATYPDVFAAIAPFAGCAYATCSDGTGKLALAAMGQYARRLPVITVQGTADPANNVLMGESAVRQWVGTNGLSPRPSSTEHHGDFTAVAPGTGDPCIRAAHLPCAGGVIGWKSYPYTISHYGDSHGCRLVDAWYIHGLSHEYPDGDPNRGFTDPIGPDVTSAAWAFFTHHRVGAPCAGT